MIYGSEGEKTGGVLREFVEGDGTAVVFGFVGVCGLAGSEGAEFAKRDEAAEIAVTGGVSGEKNNRDARRILSFVLRSLKFVMRNSGIDIQSDAEDGFYMGFLRGEVKGKSGVHAVGVGESDGGHFLFGGSGDDFFGRGNGAKEGIVAVTMKMDEHVSPE
jgi:hypothetical protein